MSRRRLPQPTPLTRSQQMARIRGRDTRPEVALRRALWAAGLRYRLQVQTPGGRADIAVPGQQLAVFIDGCFWHGCPEHYVRPKSRNAFWDRKLAENVARDRRQTLRLVDEGWTVCRVWEHEVVEDLQAVVSKVLCAATRPPGVVVPSWRVVRVEFLDEPATMERRTLEDLVDPTKARREERQRSTKKVGRV